MISYHTELQVDDSGTGQVCLPSHVANEDLLVTPGLRNLHWTSGTPYPNTDAPSLVVPEFQVLLRLGFWLYTRWLSYLDFVIPRHEEQWELTGAYTVSSLDLRRESY